jgi:predicted MFS family arabinose efflux permease
MSSPEPGATPERPPLWTARFAALIASQICFGYAFSSYFLLPTFLTRELGASASTVGAVMSLTSAAIVVLLPLVGAATDRFGRRPFIALGGASMALASFAFLFVDSVGPLLYLVRLLQAVSFSMSFAAAGALAVDLAPPARVGQAVGLYGLTFLAMNGVASASVERLAARAGWDAAFAAAGVAAVASVLLCLRIREPARERVAEQPGPGESALAVPARSLAVMAMVGIALGAMFSFAQLYAAQLGATGISLFFVAYAVCGVIVRGGFGHLLDDWAPRRVALGSLAAYVLVVAATMKLAWFGLVAIGAALGLAHGLFYPSFTALALHEASGGARGRVIANVQAAFSLGGIATAGLGVVADRVGYPAVFGIAAAGLFAGLCLMVSRPRGREWREPLASRT